MSGPKNILLVERDSSVAASIESLLYAGGCELVATAKTAATVTMSAGSATVDLVLFSIEASRVKDQLDEARNLRQRMAAPLIFLVDEAGREVLRQWEELTPVSYVSKPVQARELWLAIEANRRVHALEARLRQIEAKMLQAQRLEGIGVMAGGIAHDFNNLLTGVFGLVAMARTELPANSPVAKRLDQIERSATRGTDLCQRLMVHAGAGSAGQRMLSVDSLVEEALKLARSGLQPDISMQTGLAGNLPAVRGEEVSLRQVVANLIANSVEAIGGAAGVVRVATSLKQMDRPDLAELEFSDEAVPGEYIVIEVADTGCGMDEATMSQIFDPVFTTKSAGRGLGLAVVSRIVRKHRGGVEVESTLGRGAIFRVFLPVAAKVETASSNTAPSVAIPGGGTVMVVDDDDAVRALAKWVVERAGYRVIAARDGDEALRLFKADPGAVRLVLLDLTMPRMSGAETLVGLRAIRQGVPVIVITGHGEDTLAEDEQAGVVGYLQKPFGPDALRAVLHRHVPITPAAGAPMG